MSPDSWSFDGRMGVCVVCQKPFAIGDSHFSALYQEQADLVRRDFCEKCWENSRIESYFSFWRGVIPEPQEVEKKKRRLDASLNPDMLFDILREMPDDPDPAKRRFRFVLALMLMRRKKLKLLQIARRKSESGEGTEDFLVMSTTGRAAKQRFDVADVKLNEEEMITAQDEVGRLLVLGGVEDALAGGVGQGDATTPNATDGVQTEVAAPDSPEATPPASDTGEEQTALPDVDPAGGSTESADGENESSESKAPATPEDISGGAAEQA